MTMDKSKHTIFTQRDLWLAIVQVKKKKKKAKTTDIIDYIQSTYGIQLPTDLVHREELAFNRKHVKLYKKTKTLGQIAQEDADNNEDISGKKTHTGLQIKR